MSEDNSHAGQGPVLLDIGGEIGAVIVRMPASLNGCEVEARPVAGPALLRAGSHSPSPSHDHSHSHSDADSHDHSPSHDHLHSHDHSHDHSHGDHELAHHPLVHVGVVERPTPDGPRSTAVFGELVEGTYELYLRPDGPVELTVKVAGGEVSTADWPL